MAFEFVTNIFDGNQRNLNKLDQQVEEINQWEDREKDASFEDFQKRTYAFKQELKDLDVDQQKEKLEELLPEAFAMVREAAKRVIGERTYREQLMVGLTLHQGSLAEQKTGEGKTHAAVHPMYLNALTGKGAHLVTVNDYLARRDAEWMGPIYHVLGLSVGVINSQGTSFRYEPPLFLKEDNFLVNKEYKNKIGKGDFLVPISRQEAYQCDVTYGTNNEFGFDYLRDNMVQTIEQVVQTNSRDEFGAHNFVIVDEADSILIDEARTPLIISAPAEESNQLYQQFASLMTKVNAEDYEIDEKSKSAHLTDLGVKKVEQWLNVENIYEDFVLAHHLDQALKAQYLYLKDRDYVVKDGEVIIVDTFTGRLMPGRRYSEGLHQALEAKENVAIQKESKTLATITFQNYFRLYDKLAGMSATIITEAEEFYKIYGLESIEIPTHEPVVRQDNPDRIYKHQRAKWKAIVDEIEEINTKGQPILAGTTSVENNELLGGLLKRRGVKHEILNAKNHEREAEIVANAGQKGSVTIATNMAGRGTDIKLGDGVLELGGLHVIGTERHEARRIDNQLRGRSGRQGDPGSSRFFVALDDDLMRIFGGDKIADLMTRFNLPDDMPIESNVVSKAIENSQKKVESYNFDIRKHLVEYDDVINTQREIIYERRRRLLRASAQSQPSDTEEGKSTELKDQLIGKIEDHFRGIVETMAGMTEYDEGDLVNEAAAFIPMTASDKTQMQEVVSGVVTDEGRKIDFFNYLKEFIHTKYAEREQAIGAEQMRQIERVLLLSTIDYYWMEHIDALDELRYGVRLRAYGQRDPLVEFKNEAYHMFQQLLADIDSEVINRLFKVQIMQPVTQQDALDEAQTEHKHVGQFEVDQESAEGARAQQVAQQRAQVVDTAPKQETVVKSEAEQIGRNDPCWCGSGKKYKHCHYPELPA